MINDRVGVGRTRTGQWLSKQKPIKIKKHRRKQKSVFGDGFDYLRRILLNLEQY